MTRFIPAFLAFCFVLSAATVPAQETVVEFDPARTKVQFTLDDILHTVHGKFKLKKGGIHFDPATGVAGGALVIDAASGDSGSSMRDGRMKQNILETQKYPEITFTALQIKGQVALEGDSKVEVEGIFNLHGADHRLTLVAEVKAKDGELTATTHFVVPYAKWGLKNPSTFLLRVSDKVDIDINATGRVTAANKRR